MNLTIDIVELATRRENLLKAWRPLPEATLPQLHREWCALIERVQQLERELDMADMDLRGLD